MVSLIGTPFEGSFLDECLRQELHGDDIEDAAERAYEREDKSDVDNEGRLRGFDRRVWGITLDEWRVEGICSFEIIVESYRRGISLIELLQQLAATGEPFPDAQADAADALKRIQMWGGIERLSASVDERLDASQKLYLTYPDDWE